MKLLLGAGQDRWPGWMTLDADPNSGADVIASIPPLPDVVTAQTWEAVAMIHFIEHLYLWEARALLRECHAILQPGGALILEQPDITYCARVLLGQVTPPVGEPGQFDLWGLYGNPNDQNPWYGHHWGYTPSSLTAEVRAAGFATIGIYPAQFHHPERDFRLEARKAEVK